MKKSVVDIYDLQEMAPFFKGRVGTWLGEWHLDQDRGDGG